MIPEIDLLLRLLIAHVVGDFLLQPGAWIAERRTKKAGSKFLYVHGLIHGALAMLALGDLHAWLPALVIAITHIIIDLLKAYQAEKSARWFVIDQALHLLVLCLIWLKTTGWNIWADLEQLRSDAHALAVVLAVLILIWPTGMFIGVFTSRWSGQIDADGKGLAKAGQWIGILERLLILLFLLNELFEAIGFLLAAKSVFRFGDIKMAADRNHTEYVMIGTLLSFGAAIITGMLTLAILAP